MVAVNACNEKNDNQRKHELLSRDGTMSELGLVSEEDAGCCYQKLERRIGAGLDHRRGNHRS